jgi:hypothetical protein
MGGNGSMFWRRQRHRLRCGLGSGYRGGRLGLGELDLERFGDAGRARVLREADEHDCDVNRDGAGGADPLGGAASIGYAEDAFD